MKKMVLTLPLGQTFTLEFHTPDGAEFATLNFFVFDADRADIDVCATNLDLKLDTWENGSPAQIDTVLPKGRLIAFHN